MDHSKIINNVKIRLPKALQKEKKPHIGKAYMETCHSNVYIQAKKHSGKSILIYNLLFGDKKNKGIVSKDCRVYLFVSTLYTDPTYEAIMEKLEDKNIEFYENTSFYDENGNDLLKELFLTLKEESKERFEETKKKNEPKPEKKEPMYKFYYKDIEDNEKSKAKKSKYLCNDVIIIYDDLSQELRTNKFFPALIKSNRHFKACNIIASQYLSDIAPGVLMNLNIFIIFKNTPYEKLKLIHEKLSLDITLDKFIEIYNRAIGLKQENNYNFLYIDLDRGQYRKNFNELLKK
jgi:hypothetical protein